MICRLSALCCLALFLGTNVQAASLLIDVNDRTEPNHTQPGYTGITQDGALGLVTDLGVLDISFTGVAGGPVDDRDRNELDASQPLSELLRDIVFISESLSTGTGDGVLDITVAGLEASEYAFVGYHHDRNVDHVSGDVAVSVDGGSTFTDVVDNGLYSAGLDPTTIGISSFNFIANGTDPVVFRLTGQEGLFSLSSGTFTDQDTALIAGFEIHRVPEPGTLALALLAGFVAVACRRR